MPAIPRDKTFDATWGLIKDPYRFISKKCQRHAADLFRTRLLLRPSICMTGADAARLFYDTARFTRVHATPGRIQKTLFGQGGVQSLDGAEHRRRKQLFVALLQGSRLAELSSETQRWWCHYARGWASREAIVLYEEVSQILTRAVAAWSGISLAEREVPEKARLLCALFEGAASIGPEHWGSRRARRHAERWIEKRVIGIRDRRLAAPEGSAVALLTRWRDESGALLTPRACAVELLNILRPTVAITVYVVFIAHALHRHPIWRERLREASDEDLDCFVQEVRRSYPFFPAVAARTRHAFEWHDYEFPKGVRVILDLFGTNHDPRIWTDPDAFRPERFADWNGDAYRMIPQGGGDHLENHRCAGEWITIELMKLATRFLAARLDYEVRDTDLTLDLSQLPARPRERIVLSRVQTCF